MASIVGLVAIASCIAAFIWICTWILGEKSGERWATNLPIIQFWFVAACASVAVALVVTLRSQGDFESRPSKPWIIASAAYALVSVFLLIAVPVLGHAVPQIDHDRNSRRDVAVAFHSPRTFLQSAPVDYSRELGAWHDEGSRDELTLGNGYIEASGASHFSAPGVPSAGPDRGLWIALTPSLWVAGYKNGYRTLGESDGLTVTLSGSVCYDGSLMYVFDGKTIRQFHRSGGSR